MVDFQRGSKVQLVAANGSDDLIIAAAKNSTQFDVGKQKENRLSFFNKKDKASTVKQKQTVESMSDKEKQGFINFLIRNEHMTPVEMPDMIFNIEFPIFISREQVRHRMSSINEESARSSVIEAKYYIPPKDRPIVQVGRQAQYKFEKGSGWQRKRMEFWMKTSYRFSDFVYRHLLDIGITRELARVVNPVGLYTRMTVKMNLRSLMNYLTLRTETEKSKPQLEIQEVAQQMEVFFKENYPLTYQAFIQYVRADK